MEQVAKPTSFEKAESLNGLHPLVFLDSSVLFSYLQGDQWASQLFLAEADGQVRLAVNPIVIQELLLVGDDALLAQFEKIRDRLLILPVDFAKAEALLPRVKRLGNIRAHANNILILSSVGACDFLVTTDYSLMGLAKETTTRVVTPEGLARSFRASQ